MLVKGHLNVHTRNLDKNISAFLINVNRKFRYHGTTNQEE